MRNTADVTGGKPIAVWLQSLSGWDAVNPLVAFYEIHGRKREVLFFCSVPDTTKVCLSCELNFLDVFHDIHGREGEVLSFSFSHTILRQFRRRLQIRLPPGTSSLSEAITFTTMGQEMGADAAPVSGTGTASAVGLAVACILVAAILLAAGLYYRHRKVSVVRDWTRSLAARTARRRAVLLRGMRHTDSDFCFGRRSHRWGLCTLLCVYFSH
jgi:hypothetical protein